MASVELRGPGTDFTLIGWTRYLFRMELGLCWLYNWKNYLFLILRAVKQDCCLHLGPRAAFQLWSPGSHARLYREMASRWAHCVESALPGFQRSPSEHRCWRYGLESGPALGCAGLSSNSEENTLKIIIKKVYIPQCAQWTSQGFKGRRWWKNVVNWQRVKQMPAVLG